MSQNNQSGEFEKLDHTKTLAWAGGLSMVLAAGVGVSLFLHQNSIAALSILGAAGLLLALGYPKLLNRPTLQPVVAEDDSPSR